MPSIQRFIVFAGDTCYPRGGWEDFHSSYDTKAEAETAIDVITSGTGFEWANGVDFYTGEAL